MSRACLVLVCGVLSACAGFAGNSEEDPFRRGLWPFYTADAQSWAGVQEVRALGPLLHWEGRADKRLFEARPLYSSIRADHERGWDVFYPVVAHREGADRTQTWLLLLARGRTDHQRGTNQTHLGVFFSGRTEGGKRYGGIFPLWGVFLERLGFDRIDFLLWPLFARGRRGDYTETQILWPFFAYGSGDGRRLLRVWPLFGIDKREGVHDRRFFLWPFVHDRRERLGAVHPHISFFVLPFYGRRDAGPLASRFYLLPLYMRQWDRRKPEVGRLDLLWPIYRRGREADGTDFITLRPFFARSRSDQKQEFSVLLGLVGRTQRHSEGLDERLWRLLWAGRVGKRIEGSRETKHVDLWPFYRSLHVRESGGNEHGFVRVPYLLPMRGLDPDGWDRHYNKLLEFYGARWRNDEERSSLLFGLREVRRAPGVAWESWGGLLHLRRRLAVDLN